MTPDITLDMGLELAVLSVAAFATATLSAIIGMAGGVVLLTVMLFFYDPAAAIPLHAIVQLVSNGSRTALQWPNVQRSIVLPFCLLLLPAGYLGVKLALSLPPEATRAAIGVFVLVATWRKSWLALAAPAQRVRRFVLLGGVTGFLGPIVGATGPFIAPFFLDQGLQRQQIVGTKAACQALNHICKIALFGLAGFVFSDQLGVLAAMTVAVVLGTWTGTRLLEKVSESHFLVLYRTALTLAAMKLIWDGVAS